MSASHSIYLLRKFNLKRDVEDAIPYISIYLLRKFDIAYGFDIIRQGEFRYILLRKMRYTPVSEANPYPLYPISYILSPTPFPANLRLTNVNLIFSNVNLRLVDFLTSVCYYENALMLNVRRKATTHLILTMREKEIL